MKVAGGGKKVLTHTPPFTFFGRPEKYALEDKTTARGLLVTGNRRACGMQYEKLPVELLLAADSS